MKKNQYYKNKIMYALQKIDYAKSKLAGIEHKNNLATVYFILLNYNKTDLNNLLQLTKLSRKEITQALKILKELGLTEWEGVYISGDKEIVVKKNENLTFSQYVKNLDKRYQEKYGESLEEDIDAGYIEESKKEEESWIEIDYIIKVKKERIKEMFRQLL